MSYADQIRTESDAHTMRELIAGGMQENKDIADDANSKSDNAVTTANEAKQKVDETIGDTGAMPMDESVSTVKIKEKAVTSEKTDFTKRINNLNASNVRIGYSTKSGLGLTVDGSLQANANSVLFYSEKVKPNTKYKVYTDFSVDFTQFNKTQLAILEFNSDGISVKYNTISGGNYSPEFTTGTNTDSIHLSVNNADTNVEYYKHILLVEDGFVPSRFYKYDELNINKWEDRLSAIEKDFIPILNKPVTSEKTDFAKRINLLDSSNVRIGYSTKSGMGITTDGAVQASVGNVLFYKVPLKPNTTYKIFTDFLINFMQYNKTQLAILEFNSDGISVKYNTIAGGSYSPEISTTSDTSFAHISLSNVDTNLGYYLRLMLTESIFTPTRFYKYDEININKWEDRLTSLEEKEAASIIKNECKLIEEAGTIYNMDSLVGIANCDVYDNYSTKKYSKKAKRIVPIYSADGYGRVKVEFFNPISFNSLTLVFYATDKTNLDATIRVDLSADGSYSNTNGTHLNGRYEQGLNYLKLIRPMFSGSAPATIKAVYITITSRNTLINGDKFGIMTFDSIIVDQRMRPVVLFSFDQLHQESFDNGAYQYALDNNIPFGLYCGDWQNVQQSWIDWCKKIEYENGCELGCYGGYTGDGANNLIVANATDYKTAKDNLDLSFNKFTEIFGHEPFSYAAAQGILTSINKPAIRDSGFKLARGGVSVYTGYLDKTFSSIPMWGLGYDETVDIIKGMIDNAIQFGYCLNLFTHGVFDGATDPDYMHLDTFKTIIDYIVEKRNAGLLDTLSHKWLYNAYVN